MTDTSTYTPPRVWQWDMESGGKFASINRFTYQPRAFSNRALCPTITFTP